MNASGNFRAAGRLGDEQGFALVVVLLLAVAVGAMSMAAVSLVGNATLIGASAHRQARMEDAAVAGLEIGRALLNARRATLPTEGYVALTNEEVVPSDALGQPIHGIHRQLYVGPTGIATGQYGVFGSVVAVVEDEAGNRVVRRLEMAQESFAKFAYFTDRERTPAGGAIYFAPGDRLDGPVHSNDTIRIMPSFSGPTFRGPVTTARSIVNSWAADFKDEVRESAARIEMPDVSQLNRLQGLAAQGSADFVSSSQGAAGEATMRIEFVAIDLNGDGNVTGADEGFFKVYRSKANDASGARWVSAGRPADPATSENCGHRHEYDGKEYFYSAPLHDDGTAVGADGKNLEGTSKSVLKGQPNEELPRCYPGGSDSLSTELVFRADDGLGEWIRYPGTWASELPQDIQAARDDEEYLFPLSRRFNPDFRGVIHVRGKVAISGVLRGRVTLAATENIAVVDDMSYATDPAADACDDILGLFSGGSVVVSDNLVNAPMDVEGVGNDYRSYDNTPDEVIHGVILTLGSFTVENYWSGADRTEDCGNVRAGRGCLYVTGGIIQSRRGPVGQQTGPGATGYMKRYSYDACAATNPPPYFPTTGYFTRGRQSEVNPIGFDIRRYFASLTAGS